MDFPRPFLVHLADGTVWQGTQFHSGLLVLYPDRPEFLGSVVACSSSAALTTEVDSDDPLYGARIEWQTP